MSVMDMNSRMAMAEKLSVQQLQQAVQSGSLPAYIGIPLIEQKMKAQKQVPQQPAQRPIAQEVMEQASGIDSMPSNLPVSGYADGGIMAFAEGGEVDEEYEEYLENKEEAEYEDMIRKYMAQAEAAGIEGIPINRTKKVEQKYAQGGITRLQVGGGVEEANAALGMGELEETVDAEDKRNIDFETATDRRALGKATGNIAAGARDIGALTSETLTSGADYIARLANQFGANLPRASRQDTLKGDRSAFSNLTEQLRKNTELEEPGGRAVNLNRTAKPPARTADAELDYRMLLDSYNPPVVSGAPSPKGGTQAPSGRSTPVGNQGIPQLGSSSAGGSRGTGSFAGESSRSERPKSAFDDFMADVKASRDDLKRQKQEDKYMALLSAGLGMMSGTSPNAFANIGQGAQAGVASYGASQKQRAAERSALNKNLLMGQRYQSMEDIANRTADINESRYRDIAAARGTGGDSKAEDQMRRQIKDFGTLAEQRFRTLSANVAKVNPFLDPDGYRTAQAALTNDPDLNLYTSRVKALTNTLYGLSDETPAPPPIEPPPGVTVKRLGK